ncbi:MAG TPA: sulfatase-like hydrolase/transferase [Candidatus Atribacteria bacterium]|nr:sulfatase-like hydrolase/transferase [Candidatus Atribacteria bacterium]
MNVFVIVTDSMRKDAIGAYGSNVETPHLDSLARDGTIFTNAFSEGLPTLPTRTTWWTGRYTFPTRGWQPFELSDLLLAEALWDRGYTSCLISDTYHMHKPVYNCGRGFDTVVWVRGQEYDPWIGDDIPVDVTKYHRLRGDETDKLWKPRFEQYLRNVSGYKNEEDYCLARVFKEAIKWLEDITKKQKDRLFLWIDAFDPHEPWDPPEPYRNMYDPGYTGQELIDPVPGLVEGYMTPQELNHTKSLYHGEVAFVDKWIGIFLEALKSLGLYDESVIIYTSDHGEPFGEHGIVRKARPWNYEELVHIPLIIKYPTLPGGKFIDAIVQTTDLMPTILDFLHIEKDTLMLEYLAPLATGTFPQDMVSLSKKIVLEGHSLAPLMREEVAKVRDYAFIGHYKQSWTIRDLNYSFHLFIDHSKPPELYNLKNDPGEKNNIVDKEPSVAREWERKLRGFVDEVIEKRRKECEA